MKKLYKIYPEWDDIYQLEVMFEPIINVFKYFGLSPKDDNGNLYLGVSLP